jgi:signal transduction histidine kinase
MVASRPLGGDYLARAFAAIIGASAVHLALSQILLVLMADASADWYGDGPRQSVTLIVATTALVQLSVLYLRAQYAGPSHVSGAVPAALRIVPPMAAAVAVPLTYDQALLDGAIFDLVANVAPVVATTWATAIVLALLTRHVLHSLAVRDAPPSAVGIETVDPPTLVGSLAHALAASATAATIIVLGAIASRREVLESLTWSAATALPAAGLVAIVLVAAFAGASLALGPSRNATSVARRLDAVGYSGHGGISWPIVATSFDEIGQLFSRLEDLRGRLAHEIALYQRALDRTRDADTTKAAFLSAVSHELRTPLNSVCGFAQLLLEGDASSSLSDAQAEDVRLIQAGGEQLLGLINDILDISMIETGELGLVMAEEDIGQIVDESARIHQPLLRDRDVELVTDLHPDLPPVICDRRRIGQILANLITNAIKFTEHGSITLRASLDLQKQRVVVRVTDTGVGIAPTELDAIFEAYRQAGSSKRRHGGTGLGLAIARSLAIHHAGSLTVTSSLGEGSTFTLALPLDPDAARRAERDGDETATETARQEADS